jgi:uncharacterized membrane protein
MMTPPSLTQLRLTIDPLLDPLYLWIAAACLLLLVGLSVWHNGRRALWRLFAGAILIGLLLNPSLVRELRTKTPDVVLVIVDRSPSQMISDRPQQTDAALAWIKQNLEGRPDIELRIRETQGGAMAPITETRLFEAVDTALSDIPSNRRGGVILISDGRITDVPSALPAGHAPIHLLMTGKTRDHDLQIRLLKVPTYGLTGQEMAFKFRIEDMGASGSRQIEVALRSPDGIMRTERVETGTDQDWTMPLPLPGQNVFELTIPNDPDELTTLNNRAVFSVTGVRDRLRVLLVSGEPHAGGRTWRDLFKADSGVDLIHFTILRSPQERDATPQRELSLIAFPIRELFEVKLNEFDLIVLDRFHLNNILPDFYFQNIRTYVENGGALLEVSGPTFGTEESLYNTAMGAIFPTKPNGQVIRGAFKPTLTPLGKIHPVTQTIAKNPVWGSWLQFVPVTPIEGDVLMTATGGKPLLIINHVEKGRIAQLASDQIWLWSRGYEGGGPTEELLRRTVHWLMKEPELEEDALDVRADAQSLTIRRRQLKSEAVDVDLTRPDGTKETLKLEPGEDGWLSANLKVKDQGIYEFASGQHRRMMSYGDTNSPELRDLIASKAPLTPIIDATKGAVIRLEETPQPAIRNLALNRDYGGRNWIGLRQNDASVVTGTEQSPLVPPWLALLLSVSVITLAWWQESRRR